MSDWRDMTIEEALIALRRKIKALLLRWGLIEERS